MDMLPRFDLDGLLLCPETMGKLNQLGTLDEVLSLCELSERMLPTIDFGHLHAAGQGCLNVREDFERILDRLEQVLGKERAKNLHVHFTSIEYTAAGEKRHRTFAEKEYGPPFRPLAQLLVERGYHGIIICESSGTMAEDALQMKLIADEYTK
jgi:deoxyribonuclease-4